MNQEDFIAELAKLRSASTFLSLRNYRNVSGEVANYSLVFHMSYEHALLKSIAALESYVPDTDLQGDAKHELLRSYHASVESIRTTPIEEVDDSYTRFFDSDGEYIKGVKLHTESDTLHLYGLVNHKIVQIPGVYKKINSKPLTIEKNKLARLCPVSKFRQFKILPFQVESIRVEGLHLLPPLI